MSDASGETLELRCAQCKFAFQMPATAGGQAKFCPACGAPLAAGAPAGSDTPPALHETTDFSFWAVSAPRDSAAAAPAPIRIELPGQNEPPQKKAGATQIMQATHVSDARFVETQDGTCLSPGVELAGCRVLRFLGRGGMGQVYEVEWLGPLDDEHTSRVQALKILLPDVSRSRPYVEQFLREAQIATRLNHPNIVRTYEAGYKQDVLCLRMELVRNGTLRERLKPRTRFTPRFAAQVIKQIGEGLTYAHDLGVLHRDVKPENILIDTSSGAVRFKLSDFGLIKQLGDVTPDPVLSQSEFQKVCDVVTKQLNQMQENPEEAAPASNLVAQLLVAIDRRALQDFQFKPALDPASAYQDLAKISGEATISLGMHHGECLGTPVYMSPEQIEGRRTDGRSDLYSLGTLYYELLTGQPPYRGTTAREVITRKLSEPIPPLQQFYAPADWIDAQRHARIVELMLQKDKRCRYRTMRFGMDDMDRVLRGEEPWCSNSRALYADAERLNVVATSGQAFPTDPGTSMLLNLLQAVFEMV